MTHKVHPKSFRLKETTDWDSRGFYQKKMPFYLEEDFKIREFIRKRLKDAGVQNVEIERYSGKINVVINTARPGLIIGRGGAGAEDLKKSLDKILSRGSKEKRELRIEIKEVKDPWTKASLVGQSIAQQIEKRIPFRRAIKQALEKAMAYKEVKGARIEIAGRLDGSDIARRQWLLKGRLPRQTIRADIDYAQSEAHCSYGVIGIKVWIYKGDKFD